ncbi:ABC transporter substrate-binding protein [Paenibacillus sp. MMS18-CY102]|uniref:ABC transporter substrate-binding protein n=1 Tax=Paenibacillus sp. MMS18-CY102 TaxID=2682849 RepID=UPI0013658906|nr:extracellular solute-binding protein [Paenibacillus sp. MMS18-CY102]MWC30301.1 extracellular solute-binding protein [Paenibacillus sp. MMS18-CY102]
MTVSRRTGILFTLLTAILLLPTLAGCSDEPTVKERPEVLKVLDTDAMNFNMLYGDYINALYPDTTIKLITSKAISDYSLPFKERIKGYIDLVQREQPDLIIIRNNQTYRALADQGLLADLSPYMNKAGLNDGHIHPGVLEIMKQNKDGQLYGIAPAFDALQLFYNKDLFEKYGIEPPHDGMTWAELLDLSYRFTAADKSSSGVIGYYESFSSPLDLAYSIGETEGIAMHRLSQGMMTVNTPAWRSVFQTVLSNYKNGTFRAMTPEGKISAEGTTYYDEQAMKSADWFGQGKAAMSLGRAGNFNESKVKFKVGAVNPPVDEGTRTRSSSFNANQILAVRAGSPLTEASWGFIQFMLSDYVAKVSTVQSAMYGVPSNLSFQQWTKDEREQALYRQMPALRPNDDLVEVDNAFYSKMNDMLKHEIDAALADKHTIDDMLGRMQEQGQAMIDAALKEAGKKSG